MFSRVLVSILVVVIISTNCVYAQSEPLSSSTALFNESYSESYPGYIFQFFDNAGDLNGDGVLDFTRRYTYPDLTTSELTDYKQSRFYYFGSGEKGIEPDVELEDNGQLGFTPIGDLNGDTFEDYYLYDGTINFDLSGGERTDVISTSVSFSLTLNPGSYEAGKDLNNDGFEDVLLFHESLGNNRQLEFEIIYGAEEIDSVKAILYTVEVTSNDNDRLYTSASFTSRDLDADGNNEILVYGYSDNSFTESEGDFLILKKNQVSEYEIAFRYNLTGQMHSDAELIYMGEFTEGGLPEIFLQSDDGYPTILELDFADDEYSVINEIEIEEYQYSTIYPVGDFDGNGVEDFFTYGVNFDEALVLFGTNTTIGEFEVAEISLEEADYLNGQPPLVSDFNQDDKSDFILGFSKTNGTILQNQEDLVSIGFFIFEGNEERNLNTFRRAEQEVPATETPLYTCYIH